jgi:(p)ppGpp synthase/HD superfamily hydrolase
LRPARLVAPPEFPAAIRAANAAGERIAMHPTTTHRPLLSPRFDEAVGFALAAHSNQSRKGSSVPYAAHLLAVCSTVLDFGGTEDEAIAALLHDAPEDCGGWPMLRDIALRFGPRVASIVMGCTDAYLRPKPPWRARKSAWIVRVAHASRSVKLVAAADKLHNLRSTISDLGEKGREAMDRFNSTPSQQVWYYEACLDAFGDDIPQALRRELVAASGEFRRRLGDANAMVGLQRPLDLG